MNAAAGSIRERDINPATRKANTETVLTPRFYTTDFDALERIDLALVRDEWNQMMSEFDNDANVDHFERPDWFSSEVKELPGPLQAEFLDFMVSSVTSEYSGCVLYADIAERVNNPEIKKLMQYMTRDEARHAGFINRSLKDYGIPVDLGYLKRNKKTTYFKPKFIYYATYLSEKIGYARYITIFRNFERHPERRFHPIFRWFEQWCNDEFRHGEAFALIMRANPHLLRGHNRLWIRFFLLAVFATMYVRDHSRPEMHKAMGLDPTDYDYEVFEVTSQISKQVFPFTLDIHNPVFRARFEKLRLLALESDAARQAGGVIGALRKASCLLRSAGVLASLYMMPVVRNELPEKVRMAPAW